MLVEAITDPGSLPGVTVPAVIGMGAGLWLLVRGLPSSVRGTRIADTATSSIAAVAVGEVTISGLVEAAELHLVSPLQSVDCVYYRSEIDAGREGTPFREERSVGFRVRDASGSLRVFPRGAAWDVPDRFDATSGWLGEAPVELSLRQGAASATTETTREEQVAALLTVRTPTDGPIAGSEAGGPEGGRRRYREARLEPGDPVTILGRVLPFGDLPDPAGADVGGGWADPTAEAQDPAIAADLAAARASGSLVGDPATAWGNAAIPGFGIGEPVRPPELDPAATPPPLAGPEERARFERVFDLTPETLVLAASSEVPLVIAAGLPTAVVGRDRDRLIVGLLGAILTIGSVMALAASVSGLLGP